MYKYIGKTIKATIVSIIVALFITIAMSFIIYLSFRAGIDETISIINKVSIDINVENKQVKEAILNQENQIENYPEYGTQYATIQIPKIDVNLPVYFGDTLEVLKKGVGHSSGSYFPGEGGSIVYW